MKSRNYFFFGMAGLLAMLSTPASARVAVRTLRPSVASPQVIGTSIKWMARATDSNAGPLTFRFSVAPPGSSTFAVVRDYNVGTKAAKTWTSPAFVWVPTGPEGIYQIQVEVKDFTVKGKPATKTVQYHVTPLVTGSTPVVAATANPLVALFSAPSCAAGSSMQVVFQPQTGPTPAVTTYAVPCHPPRTMTFEIAGMYPSTAYNMFSQTVTGSNTVNGPTVTFTTGALPTGGGINFPTFKTNVAPGPNTDTTDWVMLRNMVQFGNEPQHPDVATDLTGKIIWYYAPAQSDVLSRLLPNSTFLSIESNGPAWNPNANRAQYLRQVDLAGNIVRETNTGILQQQLLAMGATDAAPCNSIATPAPVGAACLGAFHHDAIQSLPNGYTVALTDIEKIFPAGTQGDTSGKPVDIIGDFLIVLDNNWQVVWYFDVFDHDSGAPQLDITRTAILGATCVANQGGCPPVQLLSSGIAPAAHDWLHVNTIYYWPQDHDLLFSSRHQDWILKVDYNDGKGTGNILWRLGKDGDFTFNNVNSDPYPWFSAQHDVGIENGGLGPMTMFDNGDTRVSNPPIGLGSPGCKPNDCNSRGMAINIDESAMAVTPVMSQDLGYYSGADGSAQLLSDGNYFFLPASVYVGINSVDAFALQVYPTAGTINGTIVLNLQGDAAYRAWQMPSLYAPPIT